MAPVSLGLGVGVCHGGSSFGPDSYRSRQYAYINVPAMLNRGLITTRRVAVLDTASDQYMTRASDASLSFVDSGGVGVAKWSGTITFEPSSFFNGQVLCGKFDSSTNGGGWAIILDSSTGKRIRFYQWTSNSVQHVVDFNAGTQFAMSAKTLYKLDWRFNGANAGNDGNTVQAFLNRTPLVMSSPSGSQMLANFLTNSAAYNIGRGWPSPAGLCFGGRVHDHYLWNGLVSDADFDSMYNGGDIQTYEDFAGINSSLVSNMVAGWKLNGTSTQTDVSGHGLTLSSSGSYADQIVQAQEMSPNSYLLVPEMPFVRQVKRMYEPDLNQNGLASGMPAIVGRVGVDTILMTPAVDWSNVSTGHVWGNINLLTGDTGEYFWLHSGDDRYFDWQNRWWLVGGYGPTSTGSAHYTQVTRYDAGATINPVLSPPTAPNYWPNGGVNMLNSPGTPGSGMKTTGSNVSVPPGTPLTVEHACVDGSSGHDQTPGPHRIRINGVDMDITVGDGGDGRTIPNGWMTRIPTRQYWGMTFSGAIGSNATYAVSHVLALAPSIGDAQGKAMSLALKKMRGG